VRHEIVATVFDKRGRVLSKESNSYIKTHPEQAKYAAKAGEPYKVFLHAEIAALIKAKGKGYKIKVERYNANGKPLLAAPCPICMMAIQSAGIVLIEHTVGV
jgi:tRNA(Arg) A34 adenosine deaminase TadA